MLSHTWDMKFHMKKNRFKNIATSDSVLKQNLVKDSLLKVYSI